MFHDPGEFHMVDPTFVHHKRWHSISFEELQKESSNFQRPDFFLSKSAIFANPDSYRFNGSCLCTMTKEKYLNEKSLIERQRIPERSK